MDAEKRDNIPMRLTVIYQKVFRDDLESSSDENVPAKGSKVRRRGIILFFFEFSDFSLPPTNCSPK